LGLLQSWKGWLPQNTEMKCTLELSIQGQLLTGIIQILTPSSAPDATDAGIVLLEHYSVAPARHHLLNMPVLEASDVIDVVPSKVSLQSCYLCLYHVNNELVNLRLFILFSMPSMIPLSNVQLLTLSQV
jgi:hypothetical protein